MSKPPSDKTQIAKLKRQLSQTEGELNTAKWELTKYRSRATVAEQQVAEWKARFDLLLSKAERVGDKP